jgi:peptidoglycan hydrolase-like protein with peptidoglycan-binding domain
MKRPISIVLATLLCLLVLSVSDCVLASSGVLRFGSRGEEVRLLQQQLNERGYLDHQPTGYFGPLTTQAVIGFQLDYCLKVDGMVGPQTLEALRNNGEELPPADDPETDNKPVEVPETESTWTGSAKHSTYSRKGTWRLLPTWIPVFPSRL